MRPRPEDVYWSAADSVSDGDPPPTEPYIDPWDLENYAYIREHLDSIELPPSPAGGDQPDSLSYEGGPRGPNDDYADIDEVQYESRPADHPRNYYAYGEHEAESAYEMGPRQGSLFGIYDRRGQVRKVSLPVHTSADYMPDYYNRQAIYSRLDERSRPADGTMPIYDDVRGPKPHNFGLTNYGHLKIDYSLSWNDLHKYIRYHS